MNHMDAVIQILPKFSILNRLFQVFVGREYNARIDANRLGTTEWLELEFLQSAKQFDLQRGGGRPDFVQEERSPIRCLELPNLVPHGAGERSSNVAEEFAFQQVVGQGSASDFHEGGFATRRLLMDRASDHALSCSIFSRDENGSLRIGHLVNRVEDLQHPKVVAQDAFQTESPIEFRFQASVLLDNRFLA